MNMLLMDDVSSHFLYILDMRHVVFILIEPVSIS